MAEPKLTAGAWRWATEAMRRMPIEQGAVDADFLEHEFKFLTQGFVDLAGRPGE